MRLVDSHCHLNYDYSPKDEAQLLAEAAAAGVSALVTIGTEMGTLEQIAAISARHPHIYHTVGVHPHEAGTVKPEDIQTLRVASRHPKCRGIGEIGLDYHYDHSPREIQRAVLDQQLALALELRLPVVIHSRDAEEDLLASLTRYAEGVRAESAGGSAAAGNGLGAGTGGTIGVGAVAGAGLIDGARTPGIIHCFSGTQAFGEACIALGFYISFSGILTFKTAEDLRTCARIFPLDRLLVETDSPYLAPIPFRGRKCEPSMVKLTAQKIADLKGLTLEEVAQATTRNAERAFGIVVG